jgi:AP-1 complex subunit mu
MRDKFGLKSVEGEEYEGKKKIKVKFEIKYLKKYGIKVRYLKIIEKSGYKELNWVR